jgi:hypothetical protein
MKTNSRHIAGLVGPTLIAISLSEALNLRLMAAEIGPNLVHLVYLNGTLLFVAGLSIVRAHNHWTADWPVLVTLTGWLVMLGGLIRMFAPVSAQGAAHHTTALLALLIILLALGIFLTFKALAPEKVALESRS